MPDNKIKEQSEQPVDGRKVFAEEYQKLCEKTRFRLVCVPQYMARDDGTFSLILSYQVGEMPKS